jgi:signal peptide peptidase SppA
MTYLASRLLGTPLLIHRPKLDVILSVVGPRMGLFDLTARPSVELASLQHPGVTTTSEGIAVIPIHGSLVKRVLGMEAASGLTSYAQIASLLDAALGDPQVSAILLDIDSPGGEASGSFELARRVRDAATVKPVWAVANDAAYSAAYAIACSAQRVVVTETGGVGSIGVIALHVDQSVKDAQDGYRFTAITAGLRKNDFSPHEPLSDPAKTELQAEVDRLYGLFAEHVASMRGLQVKAVRSTEAGLYFGANAIVVGLADALGTLEATLGEFKTYLKTRRRLSSPARAVNRGGTTTPLKGICMQEPETLADQATESSAESPTDSISVDQAVALVAEAQLETTKAVQASVQAQAQVQAQITMQAQTKAIAELCLLAGVSDRAVEFIAAGHTEAQVRQTLIEARAAQSDATAIRSAITVEAGTAVPDTPESSPIVAAVKKLITKE